jgi:hypothetical protein
MNEDVMMLEHSYLKYDDIIAMTLEGLQHELLSL